MKVIEKLIIPKIKDPMIRTYATVWCQSWEDGDYALSLLKKSVIPINARIELFKPWVKSAFRQMTYDLFSQGELKAPKDWWSIEAELDKVDWSILVSSSDEDLSSILRGDHEMGRLFNSLWKGANAGLDLLKNTSKEKWIDELEHLDSQAEFTKDRLHQLWDRFNQSFMREIKDSVDKTENVENYNRFKEAFDDMARKKGLDDWRYGTSDNDWLSP